MKPLKIKPRALLLRQGQWQVDQIASLFIQLPRYGMPTLLFINKYGITLILHYWHYTSAITLQRAVIRKFGTLDTTVIGTNRGWNCGIVRTTSVRLKICSNHRVFEVLMRSVNRTYDKPYESADVALYKIL